MVLIRHERPGDGHDIEHLLDLAFGPGRFAKTAYRLREGVAPLPELAYVAEEDGVMRGTVRYWPVSIGGMPSIMLGPIAVPPEHRGRGIAISLMETSIAEAARLCHRSVILVGDEPYYSRVGFARVPHERLTMPGPVDYGRLLWRELAPGGLDDLSGAITRPA
jgi:predicted N-acetyltransferase YhbS